MQSAYNRFQAAVRRVHHLGAFATTETSKLADISDLLRAQLAMLVSAHDYYVHEIVRIGMLEIFTGKRPPTLHFEKFKVSIGLLRRALAETDDNAASERLDAEIRQQHALLSFQKADKVSDAIRLIHLQPLWPKIANRTSMPLEDIKERLDLIVDRRNKIVHEADYNPSDSNVPDAKWPISQTDVQQAITFIETIDGHIYDIVRET